MVDYCSISLLCKWRLAVPSPPLLSPPLTTFFYCLLLRPSLLPVPAQGPLPCHTLLTLSTMFPLGLQISQMRPGDPEVPKMVARLHHRMGNPNKASEVLERHMREHPGVGRCGGRERAGSV